MCLKCGGMYRLNKRAFWPCGTRWKVSRTERCSLRILMELACVCWWMVFSQVDESRNLAGIPTILCWWLLFFCGFTRSPFLSSTSLLPTDAHFFDLPLSAHLQRPPYWPTHYTKSTAARCILFRNIGRPDLSSRSVISSLLTPIPIIFDWFSFSSNPFAPYSPRLTSHLHSCNGDCPIHSVLPRLSWA